MIYLYEKGPMGCLASLASSLWPYVCSAVKFPMGCLASLASSLWPYVCSAASEVAERPGSDMEEATNVCIDAKNCGGAWAVVVILGLFILGQNCWRWVRRKLRKQRQKFREHERRNSENAYYQYRKTASLKHIQGSTAHKAPSNYNTWTKYWEKVMGRRGRPQWCPCKYPDGKRRKLEWGKNGAVHGAHVLFQDIIGNSYGGIVPVTSEANHWKHEYPIKYECDVVTVLNVGEMTYVGSLESSGSREDKWRDPNDRHSTWIAMDDKNPLCAKKNAGKECKRETRRFQKIYSARQGELSPRVIVEGYAKKFGKKPAMRIRSAYTQQGTENQYIFLLANVMLMQDEEKPFLSEKHEPKIFKFCPGTTLSRPRESPAQCKNQNPSPPPMSLHNASKEGNIGVVQQWLDRGADVNQADKNGWTPLFGACLEGHVDVARLLLDNGAEVVARRLGASKGRYTPLHMARSQGHAAVVALLEEHRN